MELLTKLGIDWKLLLAQVVNFTILLGVLTYFVYRPLLNLLDARRERIRKALEEAERIEKQQEEMEALRTEQLRLIDKECGLFLERTKKQAEKMQREILDAAQKEAAQLLVKGRAQLTAERADVLREVQGTLTSVIVRMTEKILEREFSDADERRLLGALAKDLPTLLR